METYASPGDYLAALEARAALPAGFRAGRTSCTFRPRERSVENPYTMNLSLLLLDDPSPSFAGIFTRNAFPGHPVTIGRKRLSMPFTRGVLVNNKISNVCTQNGDKDAEAVLARLAEVAGGDHDDYFPASTGVIGWRLPVEEMLGAVANVTASLKADSLVEFAKGIMTTDRFPKVRSTTVGEGRIVAAAKGAGMIEPNMATMLAFVLTDLDIKRDELQEALARVGERTFNRISIDSDQSTSDTLLAFSSRKRRGVSPRQFEEALAAVCAELVEDIVRNGEGTTHVIRVSVSGAPNEGLALGLAKAIVNSPLVKTAVFGNDPNVGRLVMAIGDFLGSQRSDVVLSKIRIRLGDSVIFSEGTFRLDSTTEERLSAYLKAGQFDPKKPYPEHDRTVDIVVDLAAGQARAQVIGSDLSYDYVRENADYRT